MSVSENEIILWRERTVIKERDGVKVQYVGTNGTPAVFFNPRKEKSYTPVKIVFFKLVFMCDIN